jgi:hypothetical protein
MRRIFVKAEKRDFYEDKRFQQIEREQFSQTSFWTIAERDIKKQHLFVVVLASFWF